MEPPKEAPEPKFTSPFSCMMCHEYRRRLAVCQPCGHFGLCDECLEHIIELDGKCPVCRCKLT